MSGTGIRYMAELEELIEGYRAFAASATLPTPADQQTRRKLLKRTQKIIGLPPDVPGQGSQILVAHESLVT
jgi:hypothetical protein